MQRIIGRFSRSLAALVLLALCCLGARPSTAVAGEIPSAAKAYQRELTRLAHQEFGLQAPVALFAAQIHQESTWRPNVSSRYADGLAQFTPATAAWIAGLYPSLGEAAPFSPGWAMRAMLRYDRVLLRGVQPWDEGGELPRVAPVAVESCERWAMALAGYNGGPGWIARDRRLAFEAGDDPDRWWCSVERHTARADWARRENRSYPRRILRDLEARYLAAGWQGQATC